MRILKLSVAVALMAGSLGLTTAASAQHHDRRDRVVQTGPGSDYRRDVLGIPNGRSYGEGRSARHDDRRYRSDRRYRNSRSCRTVWKHHRRVRVCR